jgi:radical SAM superfamily enzyme YgiQ (UPF0313 family)
MARVALVKLFTGLNLGVSQLSGELQRAGHDSLIVYFKDFLVVPVEEASSYRMSDYPGIAVSARAKEFVWNCYTQFSEREYDLLIDTLRRFDPDLIGFGLTSLPLKAAAEVTAKIKQHLDVPVIWGGSGPTLEPDACLEHVEMVCVGEGEGLIVDLANRIDAGADYADLPNLALRRNGTTIKNPTRPLLELEDLAIPDFEPSRTVYINDDQIRHDVYPPNLGSQYIIMTTRGCPFSCSFCIESVYQDMFGKKNHLRRRTVDQVIEELVAAKAKLPIKQVMFYDDVFTTHPRWLREFAPRYKAEVGLPFWCYTYPTTTNKDELLLLKDAGLRSITMGIQSGSEEILRNDFNRPVAQQKAIEASQLILDCGLEGYFDLITKVQFEKEEHCRETFDFLLQLPQGMKSVGFGHMTMFPGYGYTKKVEADGAAVSLSDTDYAYYHRLYLLTRTPLPRRIVKAIGSSRIVRRYPALIDRLLPKTLPAFFLLDGEEEYASEVLNLPHAQAVIPGGKLERSLSDKAAAAS